MTKIKISVNQLVVFPTSTNARKMRIIRDQKSPDTFKVAWYQLARSSMKKSIVNKGDHEYVIEGIERLKNRVISKPRQIQDRYVSLEAMQRFLKIKLPPLLKNHEYLILNEKIKTININGVDVVVSPDVIFQIKIMGKLYLGAIKLHISKNNIFDLGTSQLVSTVLHEYLREISEKYNAEILPELCLSIDVFGERIVSPPKNLNTSIKSIKEICEEVKKMWNVA